MGYGLFQSELTDYMKDMIWKVSQNRIDEPYLVKNGNVG